ncbi:hypothetical protein [Bacillus sp. Bos-x628]|uniref:hypothetical protein n=1 Tax=Bacillus maqinnsis TaxID=3229854 RepID=UPI00338DF98D
MEQLLKELLQEMKEVKQEVKKIDSISTAVAELAEGQKDMKFQLDRIERRLNGIPNMFELEAEKRIIFKDDMKFYDNKIIEIEKEIDKLKRA